MCYHQKIMDAFTCDELAQLQKMTFVRGLCGALVDEDDKVVFCEDYCESELALIYQSQSFELELMEDGVLPNLEKRQKALIEASDQNLVNLRAFRSKHPLILKNGFYLSALGIVQFYPMFNYEDDIDFDLRNANNYLRSTPEFIYHITKCIETGKVPGWVYARGDILTINRDNIDLFVQTGRMMLDSLVQKH